MDYKVILVNNKSNLFNWKFNCKNEECLLLQGPLCGRNDQKLKILHLNSVFPACCHLFLP